MADSAIENDNSGYIHGTTFWGKASNYGDTYPWVTRYMESRGFAAFSTRSFQLGELVCAELPTVKVSGWHPYSQKQIEEIESNVKKLSPLESVVFYDLANEYSEMPSKAAGIFMTNSFDLTDSPAGQESGMFCAIARLNHSCIPNVQQTYYPDSEQEMVYASRNIMKEEEMNDCYIDLRYSREERRNMLRDLYRFDCHCIACNAATEDIQADDARRTRARRLEDSIVQTAGEDPDLALSAALDLVHLLEKTQCRGWSERYIAGAHLSVYQIAEALDMTGMMKDHIKKAHEW
eukprot:CAMPEP_0182430106 /NCGR_PEP_ID=MMETSP1167-20130531/36929_1 /TAXON_ID=2988 /ORGANISM="Mallomonas Sp, Strain CCMP3275" /LENGTH=290 /DNA_ID=CAMNT_0024614775 /DNA_START=144 /DNA_END=1013 /DNA_ORIENTATION=-